MLEQNLWCNIARTWGLLRVKINMTEPVGTFNPAYKGRFVDPKHKHRLAALRLVRGQSATMAREVHLLYTRVSAAYDHDKDMPSSPALHGPYPRNAPLPPPPTRFNGLFEYGECISLKGIDDPNEGCVPDISYHLEIPPHPPQLRNHLGSDEPAGPN